MLSEPLKARITAFRHSYMDTPKGRNHYQQVLAEEREVSEIYADLTSKQAKGEDVTEEVLKRLLPYADTVGNKHRGTRISTWSCITKDVKAWFEGAGWKRPSEWNQAARWLLQIVEAGHKRDWSLWRSLAADPIQRGFACGFITPIIHCLAPGLPIINAKVVKTYKAVSEMLGLGDEISTPLAEYPENEQRVIAVVGKLEPYGIRDYREWDIYCHWNISKRLGGGTAPPPPPPPPPRPPAGGAGEQQTTTSPQTLVEAICEELQQAQWDTGNPTRFEEAVADAFSCLGCDAEHIGGAGEADVVVTVALGDEAFTFIIDAKTCQKGGVKGLTDYLPLKAHQEQHEADFAVVVAPGFAGGNTQQFAKENGVGLLSTSFLEKLLRQHASFGISLFDLKELLAKPGLIDLQMYPWVQMRCDRLNALKAVLRVFEAHQRLDETSEGLSIKAAFWILKGEGGKFSEDQLAEAVGFLSNATVGILRKSGETFVLAMHSALAVKRIGFLVEGLTSVKVHCHDCGFYMAVTFEPEGIRSGASCPRCGAKYFVPGKVIEINDTAPDPQRLETD